MSSRRSMLLTCLMAALLAVALLAPVSVHSASIKLSYANFPPAPTFPCVQMERWKTEVEKRTNGKVAIDTYPGGTLLGAKNMMDGVIAGQADIGCSSMAYQPGRFVVTNAAGLPLGIPSARVGSLVLLDLYRKYKPKEFAQVKVITMFTNAPSSLISKKPVRSLNEIKGMNLRASGVPAQVLSAWGANPVGMPMPATVEALQKGVVDGLLSSLESLKDFNFAETCRYVTVTDSSIYPFFVVMNMDKWNSLPKDVQKVIDDLVVEQAEWTGNYMDQHVTTSVKWSKDTFNVEFYELKKKEKAQWDKLIDPITAKWISDSTKKGLPAQNIVDDIKASIVKHSK